MSERLRFGIFEVRVDRRQLLIAGTPVSIGARAFDVLMALIERRDRVVSKNELLDLVWPGVVVEENNLQVQVSALRKLLGPQTIATIPGRGYRFTAAIDSESAPSALPASVPSPAPAGNLPVALPALFGRDDDASALMAMVPAYRAVTIVGAGGIGKTRLAQAVARTLQKAFADGVWWVELAPVADASLVPAAVAQALGIALPGRRAALPELIDALRGRALLLLLDNCEHLIDAVSSLVEAIQTSAAHVHVLATSQELLKTQGEQLYRLGPLALPATNDLDAAGMSGAVALFVARVRAQQPAFALDAGNVAEVVDVCRRLDGLPLAIELAAARVPLLGVSGVRERLHERFRVLTGGARAAPRRQQTLRETLDWSHGLLGERERAVFRRAGAFAGTFGLPAAQQALADAKLDEWAVLDGLGALVDKSLLIADAGEPRRYRMLESPHAYALERLRDAGETDATLRRHAQAMRSLFEQAYAQIWSVPSQVWRDRYLPDIDNLRAALDWAHQSGERHLAVALAGASAWIWRDAGQRPEGLRRCAQALAFVDASTAPAIEARLQLTWSMLAHPRAGAAERAAVERAVQLYRALDDRQSLYLALSHLTTVLALAGDLAASERALGAAEAAFDDRWPLGARWRALVARGFLQYCSGRFDEARATSRQCLQLAEAIGDEALIRAALMYLEQNLAGAGRFDEAVARGRDLVARLRRDRFAGSLAVALGNLSAALCETGALDEALQAARESAALQELEGTLWVNLDPFALLALRRGRIEAAALALGCVEARFAREGYPRQPNEQRQREELVLRLRQALPSAQLEQLLAQGAALRADEAVRLVLAD